MANLDAYRKDMAYLQEKANKGELTSDNRIYRDLKGKAQNLPELSRWLSEYIDPYVR